MSKAKKMQPTPSSKRAVCRLAAVKALQDPPARLWSCTCQGEELPWMKLGCGPRPTPLSLPTKACTALSLQGPTTGSHQLPGQETKLEILETDTSGQNLLEHDNDDISVQWV